MGDGRDHVRCVPRVADGATPHVAPLRRISRVADPASCAAVIPDSPRLLVLAGGMLRCLGGAEVERRLGFRTPVSRA